MILSIVNTANKIFVIDGIALIMDADLGVYALMVRNSYDSTDVILHIMYQVPKITQHYRNDLSNGIYGKHASYTILIL